MWADAMLSSVISSCTPTGAISPLVTARKPSLSSVAMASFQTALRSITGAGAWPGTIAGGGPEGSTPGRSSGRHPRVDTSYVPWGTSVLTKRVLSTRIHAWVQLILKFLFAYSLRASLEKYSNHHLGLNSSSSP